MISSRPLIHFWTPGLFEFKGGIQVYSGFLLRALQSLYPDATIQVFVMHDRHLPARDPQHSNTQFHGLGLYPKRLRTAAFATQAIASALWQRPDLVITTHLNFTVAAHALKQAIGTPYWAIAHGFEAWKIQRSALQQAVTQADRILAVSEYTRERLLETLDLPASRVSLLSNTFNPQQFQIAEKPTYLLHRHGLTPDQPVLLTVNRLAAGESYHAYDRVLAALPQIRQVIPNVHYLIVGQGDDRTRLEQAIAQQQLQDCVTLTGFIPDAELHHYYALCDVFAMPSKLEGFGIVFLEAMASGKPVLASNQDGGRDAVCRGALGALVDPDDTEAIAQTLIKILQKKHSNPLICQPEALRQQAIQTFGFQKFQQTLASLLSQHSQLSQSSAYESSPYHSVDFSRTGRP
ncbi:MAG: glycosyltransferase [Oscillatoriophycideae cyanobacterium NC_groundwater_1537_Pr4_S-0.65um_50_18]|nr:glycosyltransferase [Oscillatoriophycideae cyanobacterium NC_groundwater_1537_Pr4_S-0.65um_50_18]